ncbi:MAG TPA: YfhO family protein, partial [Acetivibrio sp.]|nr:YfhO family protein [Acetivibrio sp.]
MKKNDNRKIIIAQLCFWIPALIMLAAFAKMGMAPFGKSSTMIMDMSDQYVEFLCGLKYGDIYYSWSKTLGGNYIGIFAYYVSSPLSVFTLFWPNSQMPIAVLFLTVIKIGLAGFTFSLFLKYRFRRYDLSTVLFSIMYALMAYNVVYSMCIMWLDAVIWLPVILIGVEKVLKGKSRKLLIFALFVSFISTYYISYMTGLFTALYFLYRCVEKKLWSKKLLTRVWLFASSVFLAASLGAFFLLPTLESLLSGELGSSGMVYSSTFNFKFVQF